MRRAEYSQGNGRLWVARGRLLFVSEADHPAITSLEEAAHGDRPSRALAAAVIAADFDVPPFVFVEHGEHLQGLACGAIEVRVDDAGVSIVSGAEAEPWAQINASSSAALSVVTPGRDDASSHEMWLESGVANAGGFCWAPSSEAASKAADASRFHTSERDASGSPAVRASRGHDGDSASSADAAVGGVAPERAEPSGSDPYDAQALRDRRDTTARRVRPDHSAPGRRHAAESSTDQPPADVGAVSADSDATIDARAFANIVDHTGEDSLRVSDTTGPRPSAPARTGGAALDAASSTDSGPTGPSTDPEATIGLAPGEVLLDSPPEGHRLVEALVCAACNTPNPPTAARCRKCSSLLSSSNSSTRRVPQPVLGVIHLSGGLHEPLDTDLLIGRNPAHQALGPHQRAVVHGEGDRSVSRRHIELHLEGWNVMATNFKKGASTTVESRDGVCAKLLPGTPRQLSPGDTIHLGAAWLRFEPEE